MKNKVVALLPMKEHSERVPNKNLKQMNGVPLFYHVLLELGKSEHIASIIINTDSKKIIDLCSVDFPNVLCNERPDKICGDFVEMNEIIKYDLSVTDEEHFLQTHSTNPLLKETTISSAIEFYFDNLVKYDSVFSVNKLQTRLFNHNLYPLNHKKGEILRTQDLPILYEENSNFYIFSKSSFATAENNRIGQNPFAYEMNKYEAIDIDNVEDFNFAEKIIKEQ